MTGESSQADAPLVDTHAHLADRGLLADLPAVLERARAAGIVQIVSIATDADDSATVVNLSREHPGLFAAVGIHPNEAAKANASDWQRVVALVKEPGVVAVGETGLDRYRDRTPFPVQQEYFERHLDLAAEHGLPVVIHCRQSERDIIGQLSRRGGPVRGVLHSFTGTREDAEAFLALGLHVSFAGQVTFQNKSLDALREVAAQVPADRILVETDSPYLSPHPHRGERNEPARVALTALRLALVRHLAPGDLARLTTANARRLFALSNAQTI